VKRSPLVLVPQHFGSLVFDRRSSRYAPFDREATDVLRRAADIGMGGVYGVNPGLRTYSHA